MTDTVERFTNRVENYIKYRPDYPREIIRFLEAKCGLSHESLIVDVGCGTGISSQLFLENCNSVIGVEPNAAMRSAAEKQLEQFPDFRVIDGVSDKTGLPTASADLVIAAQAFHWFDPDATRIEFGRILKPGGWVVLMWNERQLNTTPFLIDYEAFLLKYANDYARVRHENIDDSSLGNFFGKEYGSVTFPNVQIFDFEGIRGRVLSSSYMPAEGDAKFEAMSDELQALFAKHAENGRIKVFYDTNVYYSQL
ncbi:MAG: class I SAM-dependent methyltransferase [Acidobacteriota bacterium]